MRKVNARNGIVSIGYMVERVAYLMQVEGYGFLASVKANADFYQVNKKDLQREFLRWNNKLPASREIASCILSNPQNIKEYNNYLDHYYGGDKWP